MKRIAMLVCACALVVGVPLASARSHHSQVSGLDKQWLKTSMQGDIFEVRGGKLAEAKSNNPAVIKLAKTLVSDHTKSYKDVAKLARKLGVEVPKSPTPSEVWELKVVASLKGKAFDRWYSSLEAYDHVQDIQETTDEVKDGSNSDVRSDAKTEIPMLKMHLRLAEEAVNASK
jgi:putative membrane protein